MKRLIQILGRRRFRNENCPVAAPHPRRGCHLTSSLPPPSPPLAIRAFNRSPPLLHSAARKRRSSAAPCRSRENAGIRSPSSLTTRSGDIAKGESSFPHRRVFLAVGAFASFNVLAAVVHAYDDGFFYLYLLPFALDVAEGPSMIPTMPNYGFNLYWRDCLSHRLIWFDLDHLRSCAVGLLEDRSDCPCPRKSSFKRPWKRGDIVTIYSPFTKSVVTKRIIGVGGDSVLVFGEHAREYFAASVDCDLNKWSPYGVPHDVRFPIPFCEMKALPEMEEELGRSGMGPPSSEHEKTLIVPPNHVWVEGDNPLCSTDSRHFGPMRESALRGRIVMRLWPIGGLSDSPISVQRPAPCIMNDWVKGEGSRSI